MKIAIVEWFVQITPNPGKEKVPHLKIKICSALFFRRRRNYEILGRQANWLETGNGGLAFEYCEVEGSSAKGYFISFGMC